MCAALQTDLRWHVTAPGDEWKWMDGWMVRERCGHTPEFKCEFSMTNDPELCYIVPCNDWEVTGWHYTWKNE